MRQYTIAYIAIALASLGVFYVSTREPQQLAIGAVGQPADIVLEDGRVISFDYTDDMTGETIEIYADKMVYSDSVSTAEAYIAMYVPAKQTVNFVSILDAEYDIVKLETLTEQTALVDVDEVWEIRCEDIVTATTTFEACNETLISSTPIYEDRYVATDVTGIIQSTLISDKDNVKLELKNAEGWYFARLTIQFAKEESEFFIEAIGSKGDYGFLDPWFNSSWTYKKKIEINPDHVDATLTSFPVFVDLSDMGSDFFDNAKSDGCDIRIVESDDSTETAFELVDYDAGTDTGELHFLADSVSSSATTTFYMYYGNSGASCYAITDTYGAENVWVNYSAVWHMDSLLDSTTNDFDLTAFDSPTMGGVTGVVGSAVTLNGSTQSFYRTDADALDPLDGDFTITAWANTDDYTDRTAVAYKGYTAGTNHWWGLTFEGSGFSNDNGWLMDDGADFDGARGGGGTVANNTWYYLAGRYDNTGDDLYIMRDAAQVGIYENAGMGTINSSYNLEIGYHGGDLDAGPMFDGELDEIRIIADFLSTDWLGAEYTNQYTPTTFYYIGAQETDGGGSEVIVSDDYILFGE